MVFHYGIMPKLFLCDTGGINYYAQFYWSDADIGYVTVCVEK